MNPCATPTGLYIHIPFCIQICKYCDFNKNLRSGFNASDLKAYQEALLGELDFRFRIQEAIGRISSIYFGGGTPSLFPRDYVRVLIEKAKQGKGLEKDTEITLEADPKTIRKRSLLMLKEAGVNRISLGAQSFDDGILKTLGRYHAKRDILECFRDCKEAGFENISLDLIYGVPGQTKDSWERDLEAITQLSPEHVSLYNLTLARGTELYRRRKSYDFPLEELEMHFYSRAVAAFKKIGIRQYEISNFSKAGFESRHNLDCWSYRPYLGIGAGASSFIGGKRWKNLGEVRRYMTMISVKGNAESERRKLSLRDEKVEFIMLGLRKIKGFLKCDYEKRFHSLPENDFPRLYSEEINALIFKGNRIKLSPKGINLSNEVFETLF